MAMRWRSWRCSGVTSSMRPTMRRVNQLRGEVQRQVVIRPGARDEEKQTQAGALEVTLFPRCEKSIRFVGEEAVLDDGAAHFVAELSQVAGAESLSRKRRALWPRCLASWQRWSVVSIAR